MSVVLDRPVSNLQGTVTDVPLVLRPRITDEPARRPVIDIPAQAPSRVKQKSGANVAHVVAMKALMFVLVLAMTSVASTLTGQYLVEKSRTQSMDAYSRAKIAIQSEKDIQRKLDVLRSAASIEDWALSHGFRPADGLGQTSKVVDRVAANK